jgi:hypothetical protein
MLYRENHRRVASHWQTVSHNVVYMWYSFSVTCDMSVVFSIQHYVIQFLSDLWHVGGFLYTTLCDTVCQWLATRRWFSLYNIMWYSLSVTYDTSVVFSIQHYVIQFVSDLRHVGGFLYTTLCDTVCQWLATRRWFSPLTTVSSINIISRHDITEILLYVASNTSNERGSNSKR